MVHPLITLFPANSTVFDTNGLGSLAEAESCVVTEEANGEFELEMVYPISGRRFKEIANRSIIFVKANPYGSPQAFRVYKISKPMNGMVTYYASHISYDLSGVPVEPFEANDCGTAIEGLKTHSLVEHPFTFWTNISKDGYFWPAVPQSCRTLLGTDEGSIAGIYGGDFEFDNFEVKLYESRGKDSGVSIRYGKNLTDISQEEDGTSAYSGIYPYWEDSQTEELITLSGTGIVNTPGVHDYTNVIPVDLTSEFDGAPSEDELRKAAEKYIKENNLGTPAVNIDISFTQLEQTEEYKDYALLERVELFDTVTVVYPKLEITATAKVIKTVYDAIGDRYESVTLGEAKPNLSDTIVSQGGAVEQTVVKLLDSVDNATKWITNGKGYIVAVRDASGNWQELVSLDTPDINTAKKVWRLNNGGFGYSGNGYNGPYTLAITQDGKIIADFIQAGTMSADHVRGGTFIAGGDSGKNGAIQVLDAKGVEIGKWDSNGLQLNRGELRTSDYVESSNSAYTYSERGWSFNLTSGKFRSELFAFGLSSLLSDTYRYNVAKNFFVYNGLEAYKENDEKATIIYPDMTQYAYADGDTEHYTFTVVATNRINKPAKPYEDGIDEDLGFDLVIRQDYRLINDTNGGLGYMYSSKLKDYSIMINVPHRFWGNVAFHTPVFLSHTENDGGTTDSVGIGWVPLGHNQGEGVDKYYIRTYESRIISGTDFYAYGDIGCSGKKTRIVDTDHYGIVELYSNETATPYFTDLGSGTISSDGQIIIPFDDKFAETVDMNCEYQVFLTQTSSKRTEWVDKKPGYFIVHGESGATFDWMVSVPQKDYGSTRMESSLSAFPKPDIGFDETLFTHDDDGVNILNDEYNRYEKEIDLL